MQLNVDKLLFVALCGLCSLTQAYREEAPVKWSPEYLGRYAAYPSYAASASHPRFKMDYPIKSGEYSGGSRSYRPSWFVGSMGTMYKRGPRYLRASDDSCVPEGEICIYRGGLVGAVMKLSCCEATTCQFVGASFVCVADSSDEEDLTAYEKESEGGKQDDIPDYF
eukprot:TRINITY_DN21381_c0_g1_i1.p1 TRINITY_DN21381_c0_g1~~TRINITY_DN21381_c0_g1_i1.p1  ORF type:complete len:166 (-),score=29.21 TRINITY_DN21381_c0_g1_i1:214-711(-)